jgi:hypothetical protein
MISHSIKSFLCYLVSVAALGDRAILGGWVPRKMFSALPRQRIDKFLKTLVNNGGKKNHFPLLSRMVFGYLYRPTLHHSITIQG